MRLFFVVAASLLVVHGCHFVLCAVRLSFVVVAGFACGAYAVFLPCIKSLLVIL